MGTLRVLLVEDEVIVRMVLMEMLSDLGYDVASATTGEEAAARLGEGAFDLLFSDVRLPGRLSGVDLAGMARAAYPGIPIIIASGATGGLQEKLAHLSPAPVIVAKPYDFSALMVLVGEMIQKG